jgi:ribokinase
MSLQMQQPDGAVDGHDARVAVLVVGSANLDLVATTARIPAPGETVMGSGYAEHPGGKGLNQAVAAARAGAATAFVGALGDDAAGATLRDVLDEAGIDATHTATFGDVPTGRALITVSDTGENSIVVVPGANARVVADGLPTPFPAAEVVLAQLEVPVEAVGAALRAGRAVGATTILNPAPARSLPDDLLAVCDVVVPNEHEVDLLGGPGHLLALGVRAVVVTLGARGAELHQPSGVTAIAPFAVDPVDTTGAGDTFCGSLAAAIASGASLVEALQRASVAAAISTTRHGAVPSIPTAAEVDAALDRR